MKMQKPQNYVRVALAANEDIGEAAPREHKEFGGGGKKHASTGFAAQDFDDADKQAEANGGNTSAF